MTESNRNIASVLEAWKANVKESVGWFPEGRVCSTPLPQLLAVLAVDDIPCRNITHLSLHLHVVSLCTSLSKFPLFIRTPYWIRAPMPVLVYSYLN